nr:MAG TPA: hypothetical protein [Caudoviricetes sp.]
MIHCANPMYNVLEWSCFIGWWLGVITPMKRVVFTSGQVFLSDITFFFSPLYGKKKMLATQPTNE